MTTTTVPGDVTAPDLDEWLAGDVDAICEVTGRLWDAMGWQCRLPARWLMYIRRDACPCAPVHQGLFVSDTCHQLIGLIGRLECGVYGCAASVTITWLERTR